MILPISKSGGKFNFIDNWNSGSTYFFNDLGLSGIPGLLITNVRLESALRSMLTLLKCDTIDLSDQPYIFLDRCLIRYKHIIAPSAFASNAAPVPLSPAPNMTMRSLILISMLPELVIASKIPTIQKRVTILAS